MKNLLYILLAVIITSCSQQQARKPISHTEGSFMKESAERNKKIIADEEKIIAAIIKATPEIKYISSKKGYWYYYIKKNETDTIKPIKGDIVTFDYDVKDIGGNQIYAQDELQTQTYAVDKQNIMTGLQNGIKLMKKDETVTFLFPSHSAYGYHGDNKKIGSNEALICTVTLKNINKYK
jgi:gliding motility-associated peptidyl-prolyl isomerase